MSNSRNTRHSRSGKEGEQDFELNIASIIDCFTVLITYLLATASFISLGVLDINLMAATDSPQQVESPDVQILITMAANHEIQIRTEGKEIRVITIPTNTTNKETEWDFGSLVNELKTLKEHWNQANDVTLTADSDIEYKDLIRAIELIKPTFPSISIGGTPNRT